MTPLLTLPQNGPVNIYISMPAAANAQPGGDVPLARPARRRPLLMTICALLLVSGGYVLHASTSVPASADILASRSGGAQFVLPQPPLPNEIPPALRSTPPRPYSNPSFASGPLSSPGAASPSSAGTVAPASPGAPASPPLAGSPPPATAANPFGLK